LADRTPRAATLTGDAPIRIASGHHLERWKTPFFSILLGVPMDTFGDAPAR
jgi:hypothetical protein